MIIISLLTTEMKLNVVTFMRIQLNDLEIRIIKSNGLQFASGILLKQTSFQLYFPRLYNYFNVTYVKTFYIYIGRF
jgi:hypothetical protein